MSGNVHLVIGEDDFLVTETVRKLLGDGQGIEVVDSLNSTNAEAHMRDLREVDASLSTPPFLDPMKITWWKNVGFLPQGGKSACSEAVKEALEKFAKKLASNPLPDNQKFILTAPKLLKGSVFEKTMKTCAQVVSLTEGKTWERQRTAVGRVTEAAAEMNLKFASGAAELFVSRVGVDSRSLASELAKMRDYLGAGADTVTARDIDDITSEGVGVEAELWEVTDAVGERNVAKTMAALRRFESENGFAVMLTTVLERFFRTLAEVKDASERGRADALEISPFALRKNLGFVRGWTLTELRTARSRFLDLRERSVSTTAGSDELVVAEIVRTISARRRS